MISKLRQETILQIIITIAIMFAFLGVIILIWHLIGWKTCTCDLTVEKGFPKFAPVFLTMLIMGTVLAALIRIVRILFGRVRS